MFMFIIYYAIVVPINGIKSIVTDLQIKNLNKLLDEIKNYSTNDAYRDTLIYKSITKCRKIATNLYSIGDKEQGEYYKNLHSDLCDVLVGEKEL